MLISLVQSLNQAIIITLPIDDVAKLAPIHFHVKQLLFFLKLTAAITLKTLAILL